MKAYFKTILLAAVLVLVLAGAWFLYPRLAARYAPEPVPAVPQSDAIPAPDGVLYDSAFQRMNLSDFRGKPVVLNFWASWCGYCVAELPAFETLAAEYGDRVQFLILDVADGIRESIELAEELYEERGFTFPLYYDGGEMANVFGVRGLPMTFFLDAEGNVQRVQDGSLNEELLRTYIEELIGDT